MDDVTITASLGETTVKTAVESKLDEVIALQRDMLSLVEKNRDSIQLLRYRPDCSQRNSFDVWVESYDAIEDRFKELNERIAIKLYELREDI